MTIQVYLYDSTNGMCTANQPAYQQNFDLYASVNDLHEIHQYSETCNVPLQVGDFAVRVNKRLNNAIIMDDDDLIIGIVAYYDIRMATWAADEIDLPRIIRNVVAQFGKQNERICLHATNANNRFEEKKSFRARANEFAFTNNIELL